MKKKECPSCAMDVDINSKTCPICGYEFPKTSKWMQWLAIILILAFLLSFLL